MRTTKATDWWWPGLSTTTPSTAVASPTPRDAVPAVGGSTRGTVATLHASRGTRGTVVTLHASRGTRGTVVTLHASRGTRGTAATLHASRGTRGTAATLHASRGTRGQTSGTKAADPGRSTTRAPTTLKTAAPTGAEGRDTRETTGPPTGRTNTGGTSTTTTTTHGPGNTTTAGVPGTGTRNGTISGPTQTGRTTTVAPTPSRRSTCQPGTPGTSHQWRHRATATPATSDTSHQGKQHSDKGTTLWSGTSKTVPSVADKEPPVFGPPTFLQSEGSSLKDSAQPTPERPEEPGNEDVRTGGGGGGGRRQRHRPLVTRQWKTHKLPIRKTTQQTGILNRETPRQRDTPTADSDAKFHDAEESLEDTEGTESACTGLENTRVTTIAPTCHDAESADAETPECSRPTTEPCTQGTDVTDLTAKQPGEERHVQSGLHGVQAGSGGPAKRLRSSSVVSEGERRQLTLTETTPKKITKQSAPKPAGTTTNTKQLWQQNRTSAGPISVTVTVNRYQQQHT